MLIKKTLIDYFIHQKDILCVYLFGSTSAGKENRFSDVDIAVLFAPDVPAKEYSSKSLLLINDLSRLLDKNVDVVVLNKATCFLKFQILQKGSRIYENPKRTRHDFETRAIMEYFDFLPIRKRLETALINHIKEV